MTFIHSPVDGHLFYLSATVNNTAMNMGVQAALSDTVATSHGNPVALPFTLPSVQVSISSPPHQHSFFFLTVSILMGVRLLLSL